MAISCPGAARSSCPIANLLDLVGDRWTLLVVRDLAFVGRHEFKEFLRAGEGIASNILSARLKLLVESGLAGAIRHPTNKAKKLYYLKAAGKDLLPMLLEMVLWSDKHSAETRAPPEIVAAIREDRAAFIESTLARLEAWERAFLPPQPP